MFLKQTLAILLSSFAAYSVSAKLGDPERPDKRHLLSTKTEWPECAQERLTPYQCKNRIQTEIQAHVIPNIKVEIVYSREGDNYLESYWKVGIPVSIKGEVLGHSANGIVDMFGVWGPKGKLGPWFCGGWNPIQCCNAIHASSGGTMDKRGNYLECYMTQLDPVPYIKADHTHGYCTWQYDKTNKKYVPVEVTYGDMWQAHEDLKKELWLTSDHITKFIEDGQTSYEMFEVVNKSCHVNGRTVPKIQSMCNVMDKALHPPNTPGGTIVFDDDMKIALKKLDKFIREFGFTGFKPEHTIKIVVTPGMRYVKNTPKLGGGKTECSPANAL